MYRLIILQFICLIYYNGTSQSAFTTAFLARPPKDGAADFISPFNPFFGASGGYIFGGEGEVSSNFFSTGQIQLPIFTSKDNRFVVPLVTSIADIKSKINLENFESIDSSLNDILGNENGVSLGVIPALRIGKNDDYLVLYIGAMAKYNKFQSTENNSDVQGLLQFRLGGGVEYGFGDMPDAPEGIKRLIFSATPVLAFLNKGNVENLFLEKDTNYFSVEFSAIWTIRSGYGILFETLLGKDVDSRVKVGGIIALQ